MTNMDYQKIVEKRFNDSLENIMYDLCVNQNVVVSEGANILDVPKEVFNAWRNKLRLGPIQRLADKSKRSNKEKIEKYKSELQNIDIFREFKYKDQQSLDGFREVLGRKLEILKTRKTIYNPDESGDIDIKYKIIFLEKVINYLDSYLSGELYKIVEKEIRELNLATKSDEIE